MSAVKRNGKVQIAAIPKHVMKHHDYITLSYAAKALLLEFCMQYNTRNNGRLCAVYSQLKSRGWNSTATINRCIKELLNANMIELTKLGGLGKGRGTPNYYALTWARIDENYGIDMDVQPTTAPARSFSALIDNLELPGT